MENQLTDNRETLLLELAKARAEYAQFVEAVDADLKAERERRLSKYQEEIRGLVVRSFVAGARKSHIMQAYSTKDYNTINNILVAANAEAKVIEKIEYVEPAPWFKVYDGYVTINNGDMEADFTWETLEDGTILLDTDFELYPNGYESEPNPVVADWDGSILRPVDPGQSGELFAALATNHTNGSEA